MPNILNHKMLLTKTSIFFLVITHSTKLTLMPQNGSSVCHVLHTVCSNN